MELGKCACLSVPDGICLRELGDTSRVALIQPRGMIVVTSPLRSKYRFHVGAKLRVLELVLLQPATCDVSQSFVSKLIPMLF
jgi:hypothetical protein